MGRSPESPYSLCPSPTPVEQASEAVEEEKAVPIPQAATRRKSSTWKGFNLKRQLSKVDIKIKNPLKEKRNSIFYSDVSPEPDNLDDSKSSPDSDENTVIDNQSVIDLTLSLGKEDQKDVYEEFPAEIQFSPGEDSDTPFLVGSVGTQYEVDNRRKVGFAMRPDNLDLVDEDGCPVSPPRHVKKKNPDKRDQRLLSVPNIKFQRPEVQSLKDLRDREESVVSPQPSFTGNLMRRFSKFQLCLTFRRWPFYDLPRSRTSIHAAILIDSLDMPAYLDGFFS